MIYLRTGLPGASKSLNSVRELVLSQDEERPMFYNNVKLFMLDMDVAKSFSGWYYGWFFPQLKDKAQKKKLIKIMKPVHDEDEFLSLNDVPWLEVQYLSHNHFDTWLHWVKKVYPEKKLIKLNNVLECVSDEEKATVDMFDICKSLNLHFTHFEDPNFWFDLPKKSVILVDECQQFFPPRPVGSRVPQAIAKLETHRHGGYDLHFITQDSSLADQNLRKLVGRHIHFHNPFGGKRITRYESPQTFDPRNYHDKKQAKKKFTAHAVNFYGVYWSAEIHTHKFKIPPVLFVGLLTLLFVLCGLFYLINLIDSKRNPDGKLNDAQEVIEQSEQVLIESVPKNDSFSPFDSKNGTILNVDNPLTETYSDSSVQSDIDSVLIAYIEQLTKDVYINGSMHYRGLDGGTFDYAFARTTDNAAFHPLDVGLSIEPVTACFAYIKLSTIVRPITCNPFSIIKAKNNDDFNGSFTVGDKKKLL